MPKGQGLATIEAGTCEVLKLYEEGFSVDEIALETGFDELSIKAVLSNKSEAYKLGQGKIDSIVNEVISDNDHKLILASLRDIAIAGENEAARVKAAIYLHDEKAKRNQDRVDKLKDNRIAAIGSILGGAALISARIARARAAMDKAKEKAGKPNITIPV